MVSKYVSNLIPQFYIQFGQLCVKKIEYFWATFQGGCQRIWTKILYDSVENTFVEGIFWNVLSYPMYHISLISIRPLNNVPFE